jgi:hypothetical protein
LLNIPQLPWEGLSTSFLYSTPSLSLFLLSLSLSRFDKQRAGEPEKKLKGKKRVFRDNLNSETFTSEKVCLHLSLSPVNLPLSLFLVCQSSMKQQLRIVEDKIHKKQAGITNSLAPYEGILPDAPSDTFRQKKGKGGFDGNDGPAKKKTKKR